MSKEILDKYDAEVRENPIEFPNLKTIREDNLVKVEGGFNFICSWKMTEKNSLDIVQSQKSHYKRLNKDLLWRVYSHDGPKNLESHLKELGFIALSRGTLMGSSIDLEIDFPKNCDVRTINNINQLQDYLRVNDEAFGESEDWAFDHFSKLLSHPNIKLFCLYDNNKPVSCGRIEISKASTFGMLYGGAVIPTYRKKGYFRAILAARLLFARQHGVSFLVTEAWDTSMPILKKIGFKSLSKETTWILKNT